jgi:hypothetical protein
MNNKTYNNGYTDEWVKYDNYDSNFIKPNKTTLEELEEGNSVKIDNSLQKFWATITKISKKYIIGIVDNEVIGREYKRGDLVIFSKKHIFDIISNDMKGEIENN